VLRSHINAFQISYTVGLGDDVGLKEQFSILEYDESTAHFYSPGYTFKKTLSVLYDRVNSHFDKGNLGMGLSYLLDLVDVPQRRQRVLRPLHPHPVQPSETGRQRPFEERLLEGEDERRGLGG